MQLSATSESARPTPGIALTVTGLSKSFGPNKVLDRIELAIKPGEICALIGLNGSGKSTLIKILSGFHQADEGEVFVGSRPLDVDGRRRAADPGIKFVHQDLALAPDLNAMDNMALGSAFPRTPVGSIAWGRARRDASRELQALGYTFDPRKVIAELGPAERTGVAIARAVAAAAGPVEVLILDEPTAALPAAEVDRLFDAVRRLAAQNVAVLFVSHHLEEIFELADRVCVLREGKVVDDAAVSERTHDSLIEAMAGRAVARQQFNTAPPAPGDGVLRLEKLQTDRLAGLDLDIAVGEIVGIAGITGSGREDVVPAIMGTIPRLGRVVVGGRAVAPKRPHAAVSAGLACVPANRLQDALLPSLNVTENLTATGLRQLAGRFRLNRKAENQAAHQLIERISVHPRKPSMVITELSGGNQQKVVLGRALATPRTALVLDDPTQGVDVEARMVIYAELRNAVKELGVLVVSSDSEELAQLCDRVVVLQRGRVVAEIQAPTTAADIDSAALSTEAKVTPA